MSLETSLDVPSIFLSNSHNFRQLKVLNQVVFPVTYNDKFYKDVLDVGELAKLGLSSLSLIYTLLAKTWHVATL